MAKNVIYSPSRIVPLTAPADLASGERFQVGSIIAVAMTDAASGSKVSSALDGIFTMAKRDTQAVAEGQEMYHNAATAALEAASSSAWTYAGVALEAAGTTATEVKLVLNHPKG